MLWIETAYVGRISPYVKNFKQKSPYLWVMSCPLCGDVSKGRLKTRGYVYRMKTHLAYKCHHCGASMSFGNLLKEIAPNIFKEFVMDRYKESTSTHLPHSNVLDVIQVVKVDDNGLIVDDILSKLTNCAKLKDGHPVAKYLAKRLIPKDKWHLIYYTTKIKEYTNSIIPGKFKNLEKDHPRLLFPYFDSHGRVFAFSARAFKDEEPKYFTIKIDETAERVYGLERVDYAKRIYAFEGQIDSLFIKNGIAVSGSSFESPSIAALKTNLTIVPDNEPRSREITKIIHKTINLGYSVCLWPHTIEEKDVNDMVKSGKTPEEIVRIIDENTFSGPAGLLKFTQWRQC